MNGIYSGTREGYPNVEVVGTTNGRFIVLVNGFQWGGEIDRSGAGDATFGSPDEAWAAYLSEENGPDNDAAWGLTSESASDPLDDDRGDSPVEFGEGPRGQDARDRWARSYDELNGAPEGPEDC